jgi:peroxiredoxin
MIKLATLVSLFVLSCTPAQVPPPPPRDPVPPPVNPDIQQEVNTAPPSVVGGKDGASVDLASLWADKRVLLVFYMGHWCPHCQKQLAELNDHKAQFAANHTTIVAVSTDTPEDIAALETKLGLGFDVYSDPQLQTIGKWGVADYGANVAKPASFIVEPGGAISYRKIGEGDRGATVDELIAASAGPSSAAN